MSSAIFRQRSVFAAALLSSALLGATACSDDATAPSPSTNPGPTPPATALSAEPDVIAGQYIVVFRDDVLGVAAAAPSLSAKHRATIIQTYTAALRGFAA